MDNSPLGVLQSETGLAKSPMCAALAQLVRALVCGTRGPPFKPERRYHPPLFDVDRLG